MSLYSLTPLIPLFPLLAFAIIILGANRNNRLSAGLAVGAMGLSTLVAWLIVFAGAIFGAGAHEVQLEGLAHGLHLNTAIPWLPVGDSLADWFRLGYEIDGFGAAMLFMVPFVCLMIFIYASEYMEGYNEEYPRYARFFAYVSLFGAAMLALVIADNLLLLFIAWEIMGLCSYLLIGFWYEKTYPDPRQITPKRAALKAFLTTRVGDVLLFAGMLFLFVHTGTLTFREIFEPEVLDRLAHEVTIWGIPAATLIALLIFGGAVGKSAQFPLHVWLPDAMEGPTPVSALIHAATMVSAGVYLVARMLPLFAVSEGSAALQWVAIIGAITAFGGATIGLAQNDIKRVLAYSTVSQLGYMMMALGLGAFVAGIFHLLTHAFFKALLFLGSGSVIHAMEHGAHHVHDHHTDPQDMANMGGLASKMRRSFWAYMAGTLALVGIFPLAGFWSKDEILAESWKLWQEHGAINIAFWVWLAGTAGAFLTALYMGRQIGMVFWGKPRTELAAHAEEPGNRMTVPLLILAVFAVLLGFINIPDNVPGIGNGWFHGFAGEVHEFSHAAGIHFEPGAFNITVALISTVVAVAGFAIGAVMYRGLEAGQTDPLQRILGPVFTLLKNKYYVDELYHFIVIRPVVWLARIAAKFDYDWIINAFVDLVGRFGIECGEASAEIDRVWVDRTFVEGTAKTFNWFGSQLRFTQTGRAQNYLLVIALTVLLLIGLYLAFWINNISLVAFVGR
ncbi:MAG: NADH-quinone oxidoreductase subunit L [Anaerolineae bacterium]